MAWKSERDKCSAMYGSEGLEHYIFVSYAHKDKKAVLKELSQREIQGQHFWYDKYIGAGDDWAGTIGKSIDNAEYVLYFDSIYSRKSENCQREIEYAKEHGVAIESVKLRPIALYIKIACILVLFAILALFIKTVPNVVGEDAVFGKKTIAESGFACYTSYGYSEEYSLGQVMDQSRSGTSLSFLPVVITQSLGKEANLVCMPDTVGCYISDGVSKLVQSGLMTFTVNRGLLDDNEFGIITSQSAPAGYMISKDNTIDLTVAQDENPLKFEYNGYIFTVEDGMFFDMNHPAAYGLSGEEWDLFNENCHHSIWNPESYENVWLPAQSEKIIKDNPNSCYGWVIVRDTEISSEDLFNGYSELYVCPGITVKIKGKVTDKDSYNDFYVAPGGTLIFEDEVDGGVYLVNDGTSKFLKNLNGGADGVLIGNRGNIEVAGVIGKGVNLWSFYGSSVAGKDETEGTLHDYSSYRQIDAANWYEGCSGENGIGIVLGKLETFSHYSYKADREGQCGITPVIKPEDFEDHWQEEWYTDMYLFLDDYTIKNYSVHRGASWMLIAAPGVTLTIDDESGYYGTAVFSDKDSTIIINCDIKGYWPYSPYFINDGTIILNGKFIPVNESGGSSLLMNRGTFVANGEFGGSGMYCFNFAGASLTGNIKTNTYIQNLDFTPDYIPYDNTYGGALWYNEEILVKQYGFKRWQ